MVRSLNLAKRKREHDVGIMASLTLEEARLRVGTLGISALLAAAGGFLDGFTYVGHGHVFAVSVKH